MYKTHGTTSDDVMRIIRDGGLETVKKLISMDLATAMTTPAVDLQHLKELAITTESLSVLKYIAAEHDYDDDEEEEGDDEEEEGDGP